MEGFEIDATLAAADASAAEAAAANAAAAALEAKALAAANAAAADEALAAANATASESMAGALVFFALAVVIIGELYVIFKGLSEILGRVAKAQLMAAEYANEHRLAIWEEIEAMQKLKNATEKTSEALIRMNTAKDHSVELARQAIEASNEEMQARERLREASEKGKMVEIEIAEKLGFVTKLQAIQQKADVESQGIAEKAANKQAQLNKEALIAQNAAVEADTAKRAAQKNAVAASNVVNMSLEGKKRAMALANDEKNLEASKRDAEQAKKDQIEFNKGGSNILWSSSLKARMEGFKGVGDKSAALEETAESKSNSAASAEIVVNSLKRLMSPAEKAAAEAMRIAQEKTDAAVELGLSAQKATTAANINAANSPAEVAAEQRNVALKAMQETLGTAVIGKGYEMNQQQKAGAYAATPPEFKQMTDFLRLIAMQTHYLSPQSATAPGARGPQFGTRPPGR